MADGSQGAAAKDDPGADAPGAGAVVRHAVLGVDCEIKISARGFYQWRIPPTMCRLAQSGGSCELAIWSRWLWRFRFRNREPSFTAVRGGFPVSGSGGRFLELVRCAASRYPNTWLQFPSALQASDRLRHRPKLSACGSVGAFNQSSSLILWRSTHTTSSSPG